LPEVNVGADPQSGGPDRIGPFLLVSVLGEGGMGRVYLGRSVGGQLVAVKVIRRDLAADPEFRRRFKREVAAARKVSGLYTAYVVEADADAEEPWLATAYIDGPSLAEAVRERGPLSSASVVRLGAALAEGLSKIHDVGLVHRDLKPSNVLLAGDGPRIIDFGIAWSADTTTLTPEDRAVGSPGYMSPEQAESQREGEVGPPSDIFSLGSVLCYAATGRGPWGSGSTATLIYRAVHEEPNLGRLPAEIAPLVARCLAKNPADRPTPTDVLDVLGSLERAFYNRQGRPPGDYWRHLRDPASTKDFDHYPFQPRSAHAGHEVIGRDDGAVLLEPEVARDLRAAAEYASRKGRDTGGLLYGRAWSDDEGAYLVVNEFLAAGLSGAGSGRVPRDDVFTLSPADLRVLREDAARMFPALIELGWWRTRTGPGQFGPRDFVTQADLAGPGGVGLLVFGSGRDWGAAYLGPDGHVRSYAVTEPGEGAERRTATVPQAASPSAPEAVLDPATADAAPGPAVPAPRVRYARLQRGGQPAADEADPASVARDAAERAAERGEGTATQAYDDPGTAADLVGQLSGDAGAYVPVAWPAPVPAPELTQDAAAAREAAADAEPELVPDQAPAAASRLAAGRPPALKPAPQPPKPRVASPVRVPARDWGTKSANPGYVGPSIPTDVKIVVGATVVVFGVAGFLISELTQSLFWGVLVGAVCTLVFLAFVWGSRL
jgi:hypothetical protein